MAGFCENIMADKTIFWMVEQVDRQHRTARFYCEIAEVEILYNWAYEMRFACPYLTIPPPVVSMRNAFLVHHN